MNGRKQFSQWLPMLSLSTRYDGPLVTVFVFVFMGLWASFPAKATVHTTASPDTLSERLASFTQDAMSPLRDIRQVEAGWSHTCALTVDGRVLCWGPDSSIPFVVPELGPGVKAIKAGADHTCAITASGDVACWGRRGTPTRVAGLNETATTLAAGYAHTCALLATDVVKCWGSNTQGQLGDGTTIDRTIPVTVGSLGTDVVAISAAYDNSCALLGSGVVKCWGENGWGQVGDGTTVNRSAPVTVTGLAAGIAAIDVGYSHTCAITGDGKVQCWGNNGAGQLGDGTQNSSSTPVSVIGLATSAKAVSAGAAFTCSITDNDAVFCWGDNSRAALGTDQPFLSTAPVSIAALGSSVAQLSTGWNHACAVMKAGTVICWGENGGGQLGIGLPSYSRVPVGIQLPEITVTAIDTGLEHACALTNTGAVYCWGSNNAWQVNANPTVFYAVPQAMAGLLPGISTLSSGGYHSCALIKGGEVRCWGSNYHGQLGDGTPTTSETPVAVDGLAEPVTALTTGNAHSCALTTSGKALCWGNNDFGQIGDGSGAGQLLPIQVSGLDHGISAISAGGLHSCAIRNGGVLLCWGDNSEGQLGTGTRIGSQIPVTVTSLPEPVKFVSTGEMHTCAISSQDRLFCWGDNSAGQLGNGTNSDSLNPSPVSKLTTSITAIAAGRGHTCAVTVSGAAYCWGINGSGELGDNTVEWKPIPVPVYSQTSGVTAISAADGFSCVLHAAGDVSCWGLNGFGQLGDGSRIAAPETVISGCFTLTVTQEGEGEALRTQPSQSIGCAPGEFRSGEIITLTAVPATGWRVAGWAGTNADSSTAAANSLTMPASNHTAKVTYQRICYSLAVAHVGQGSNPALSPTNSTGCPTGTYVAGESINLIANPASGWSVRSWLGTTRDNSSTTSNSLIMPAGPHAVGVTYQQDAGSEQPTQLFLSLAVNAPPLSLVTLRDGGFEAGQGWLQSPAGLIIVPCHTLTGSQLKNGCGGAMVAWLGGSRSVSTHILSQVIQMTTAYPVSLRFRYFIESERAGCDNGTAELWSNSNRLLTLPLCRTTNSVWNQSSVVLPSIEGAQDLRFVVQRPPGVISSFFVDDVSLCSNSSFKHPSMPSCP